MTIPDPITEQLIAANPVPSVTFLVPTVNDANEFLAIVKGLDLANDATHQSALTEKGMGTEAPDALRHVGAEEGSSGFPLVDYLRPPEKSVAPRRFAVGVAAAILIVVGVVVVPDQNGGDVVTGPASSPSATAPVQPLPTRAPAPAVPSSVLDPVLSYRWSRVSPSEVIFGGTGERSMTSVTVGGPGLVAVGSVSSGDDIDAAVWTSVEGITWSRVPHDEAIFGGGSISSVTVGGRGLVAVGSVSSGDDIDAAVWTSADGITWSRVPHDETVFGGASIESVTAGGPGLVAIGSVSSGGDDAAAIWTSVDAVKWLRVPRSEAAFGDGVALASVTAGGPGLVAVGGSGLHENGAAAVWTSVDGTSWSRVPHDEATFGGAGEQYMTSVIAGGPGLVAVGWDLDPSGFDADAAVWTSPDGINWSRVPHNEEVFGGRSYQGMWGATAAGSGMVAVGSSTSSQADDPVATVWSSLDGITWSRVPDPEAVLGVGDMSNVIAAGAGLVAVGDAIWVAPLENRQSASSAGRCIDTETPTEGTNMTTTNAAGLTGRKGWTSAAVAAVVVMLAGSCGGGDNDSSASANEADQVTAELGFGPESSLAFVDDYFAAHNSGDIDTVFALFTADATFSDTWSPSMDRTGWEPRVAWDMAQGETLISPDCMVVDEVSDVSVTISCAYGTLDAVGVAVDAVEIPTTTELTVTPDGISTIDESYGSPDFLVTGSPFARWMDENNPEDADATGCCEADTVAESVARGELRARYATEWAAYLEANDCTYRQTSC